MARGKLSEPRKDFCRIPFQSGRRGTRARLRASTLPTTCSTSIGSRAAGWTTSPPRCTSTAQRRSSGERRYVGLPQKQGRSAAPLSWQQGICLITNDQKSGPWLLSSSVHVTSFWTYATFVSRIGFFGGARTSGFIRRAPFPAPVSRSFVCV
jgi:hypothetical protein